jgi:hypothetical protein
MAPRKVSRRIVLELGSSYSDRLRNSPQRSGDGRPYPAERGEEDSFATSFFWSRISHGFPRGNSFTPRGVAGTIPFDCWDTRSYRTAGRGITRASLERHRSNGENSTGSTSRL